MLVESSESLQYLTSTGMLNLRLDKLHPAQWFVATPINDDLPRGIDHLQVTDGTS
jgi:hypothetical protein